MKIISTKTILVLIIILTAILLAANYFFFISIKNINTKTSALMGETEVYKKEQGRLAGKSGITEILSLVEKINSYYVGKDDVVHFIEDIEKEGRSKGITLLIRSVSTENFGGLTDEESAGATKEVMRLKLEARGSWRDTMEFVAFLEHLPYKVSFASVDFTKSVEGGGGGDLLSLFLVHLWRGGMRQYQ
jgi:Tfp pilus assembly protein PilO